MRMQSDINILWGYLRHFLYTEAPVDIFILNFVQLLSYMYAHYSLAWCLRKVLIKTGNEESVCAE